MVGGSDLSAYVGKQQGVTHWLRKLFRHLAAEDILVEDSYLGGEYAKHSIVSLYQKRWHIELDLCSIKEVMQMGILRCKTLEIVRKELWIHLIGYNLIRYLIACSTYLYGKVDT